MFIAIVYLKVVVLPFSNDIAKVRIPFSGRSNNFIASYRKVQFAAVSEPMTKGLGFRPVLRWLRDIVPLQFVIPTTQ